MLGYLLEIQRIGISFNVRTTFKTKHSFRGTLLKTGPVRDVQFMNECVYSISCDYGKCYNGETSRPLEIRIKQHEYIMTQCLFKDKLAHQAYEGHKICWKESKILQIGPHVTFRKSAHMFLADHPICQPCLDISPIWTPIIAREVLKLPHRPV
jgi:hypothetical protein